MASKNFRKGVFVSYSHNDKVWLEKLQTVLKPLIRNESIELWDDTKIPAGSPWHKAVEEALTSSRVAILLVSPNFLASDFIVNEELPRILERHQKAGITIFWIAISASAYKHTELAQFQAANDPSRPLDTLPKAEQNRVLVNIADKIVSAVDVNAVANVFSIVDDFAPQAEAFVKGNAEPIGPVQHGIMARQEKNVIHFESQGQTLDKITADDLKKLDAASQQLIRAHEYAMKDLFDRWTELQPKRVSRDSEVKRNARQESEDIRRDLCEELNQILRFMDFLGKNLLDHYSHVRFICKQVSTSV